MTARDREATLIKYYEMFDEAASEEDLLQKLGSPTRAAICELRGYVPSEEPVPAAEESGARVPDMPSADAPDAQAAPEGLIEPEPMPGDLTEMPESAPVAEPAAEATAPEAPDRDPSAEEAPEEPPEETPEERPVPDAGLEEAGPEGETVAEPDVLFDFAGPDRTPPAKAPKPRVMGGRLTLYVLFGIFVCIPAAAVLIAICLCVLALGALFIASGVFVISLGFVGITVFADIMLLFGAGLVIEAIGIPIAFFAFWLFLRMAVGFVNLILRTGKIWCYGLEKEERK